MLPAVVKLLLAEDSALAHFFFSLQSAAREGMLAAYSNYTHNAGENMRLQEVLKKDLIAAMKAKDSDKTGAIRILMGEFARQREKEVSDDQVIAIIKKLIKSERELLLAKKEESSAFLEIMQEYLPSQASEQEILDWIKTNVDFSQYNNKMQAMKPIMVHFGSSVEGNTVKRILMSMA